MTITVVDYGVGNLASVMNMLKKAGAGAKLASTPEEIAAADKIILPGVGAFDAAMNEIRSRGLRDALDEAAMGRRVPVLGICLGMQLLTRGSEEGTESGFGWMPASTVRFDTKLMGEGLRIPHMGWNTVIPRTNAPLLPNGNGELRFYFANTYHVSCDDPAAVIGVTTYGYEFPSVIGRGNILGAQFHPEKSHRFGLAMLRNFAERY